MADDLNLSGGMVAKPDMYSPADALAPTTGNSPSEFTPQYQLPKDNWAPLAKNPDAPLPGGLEGEQVQQVKELAGHPNNIAFVGDYERNTDGSIIKDPTGKPVVGNAPTTINVTDPSKFTQAVKVHEQTHLYQNTRNAAFKQSLPNPTETGTYQYGGPAGLDKLHAQGKSIADLSVEQQARIQEDWTRIQGHYAMHAATGKLTPQDAADYDRYKGSYGRAIGQIAGVPNQADYDGAFDIDTTPKPPGAPPAAASGIVTDIPENGRPSVADAGFLNRAPVTASQAPSTPQVVTGGFGIGSTPKGPSLPQGVSQDTSSPLDRIQQWLSR